MSDAPRPPPPKRDVALALLEESSMFIHLDPRRPSVLVPKGFAGQHQLVLQVGLNMAIPIPDLTIDETGISCTLSFNRAPFWCRIPWSAIYALVGDDGRGGVWPEDVPPEIQQQKQGAPQGAAQRAAGGKRQKPKLAAVASASATDEKGDAPAGRSRSASALKSETSEASRGPEKVEAKDDSDAARDTSEASAEEAPAHVLAPPPRIGLAAVPPAPPEEAEKPSASTEDDATPDEAPTRVASRPAAGTPAKKTKREIPPYLRVIK